MTEKMLFEHGFRRIEPDTAWRKAKQEFISTVDCASTYLTPVLRRSVADFFSAEYQLYSDGKTFKEYTQIVYNNSSPMLINITADSNAGIVRDIYKEV